MHRVPVSARNVMIVRASCRRAAGPRGGRKEAVITAAGGSDEPVSRAGLTGWSA